MRLIWLGFLGATVLYGAFMLLGRIIERLLVFFDPVGDWEFKNASQRWGGSALVGLIATVAISLAGFIFYMLGGLVTSLLKGVRW